MRDKIFYLVCFGFGAGVLARSFFHFNTQAILWLGIISLLLIILFYFVLKEHHTYKLQFVSMMCVVLFSASLGILRLAAADSPAPAMFESHVGQKIALNAAIVDEPIRKETGVELIVQTEGQTAGGEKQSAKIVISNKQDNGYRYGDVVQAEGLLEKPKNFLTDQGKEFDYVNYLKKDGILYVMKNPKISILSSGGGNVLKRAMFAVKDKFNTAIGTAEPLPESTLMGGLVLGERAAFSQSLRQMFSDTGTIHIVTIGGYHVSLVARWIMDIFAFLPARFSILVGIISIFIYIFATGGAQTTIRAGIMASLSLFAGVTGRTYTAGRALVFVAVIMIIFNPFVLAFDVSFELSFLATIAIIFLSPKVEPYLKWISWKWLRDIASITVAMYMFALPFVLYKIGTLSLVALPANIAIVPFVAPTMIAGFATGFAGLFSPYLAWLPGKVAYVLLYYIWSIISFLSRLPFSAVSIPDFPIVAVIIIYAIFLWIFFANHEYDKEKLNSLVSAKFFNLRTLAFVAPVVLTFTTAGFLYYRHHEKTVIADTNMQQLFATADIAIPKFVSKIRTKVSECQVNGPYPDPACTPGAVFANATTTQICVPGYTKTVRSVSTATRKKVYAEYGLPYPKIRNSYEVDHFIPLALGGSNDMSNLFPEAALPLPGFHEKDVVEIYLYQEVCAGRVALPAAERQISTDWLAVYSNLTPEQILAIRQKYKIPAENQ